MNMVKELALIGPASFLQSSCHVLHALDLGFRQVFSSSLADGIDEKEI